MYPFTYSNNPYTMKQIVIISCALLMSLGASAQTDKRLKGLTAELEQLVALNKAAGFAVAVVEDDKVLYAKGFGYADYENQIPADANTLYAIGSSTKAFTSALLGILRAEDQLSFDDTPRTYIPELEFSEAALNDNIIIKDLMRHSTGLPRHDGAWYFFPNPSKDSLLKRIRYQKPFTGVRQQWYYNNFMFLVQGVIAERLTGMSWEANLQSRFFDPLGMDRTNSNIADMKSSSNKALGYELKNEVISRMPYYDISGMSPAGSINSSVMDMTKWMRLWLNKGKWDEQQIIPEDYIKEAMSSQMVIGGGMPSEEYPDIHFSNYGYGWFLSSYKGHYRVEHGGNIDGFSANVALFPTDGIGIVVLANQNGSAIPSMARNIIADYLLDVQKTDWIAQRKTDLKKAKEAEVKAKESSASARIPNTRPSHILQDYTGDYHNDGYGRFTIVLENDSLFTTLNTKKQYLHHYHYDSFEMLDVIDQKVDTSGYDQSLKIKFNTNLNGDIHTADLAIEPTLESIVFKRFPNEIDVDLKTLESYTGLYELAGTEIKVFIKNENTLYLVVQGQPEYQLVPTAKHQFSFKALEGFKVEFIEDTNGQIKSLKAKQPNGIFEATRKKE